MMNILDKYEIRVDHMNEHPDADLDGNMFASMSIDAYEHDAEEGTVAAEVIMTYSGEISVCYHDTIFRCKEMIPYLQEAKDQLMDFYQQVRQDPARPHKIPYYEITGIMNSEKDHWFSADGKVTPTARLDIHCLAGTLIAEVAGDSSYPGLYLSFVKPEDDYERTIALFEAEDENHVALKVWRNEEENESYTDRFPVFPL